jgi:hypothetical protein
LIYRKQDIKAMSENFAAWYRQIIHTVTRSVGGCGVTGKRHEFSSLATYVQLENIEKWYTTIHDNLRAVEATCGTPVISVDITRHIASADLHRGEAVERDSNEMVI